MIKELKANFYRILRSKSFIVICILIFLLSVFVSVEVKAIADNPGDWIGYLEKLAGTEESTATTEDPSAATDEAVNSDVSVSVSALSENLDMLGELDNFDGMGVFKDVIIPHTHKEKYFERVKRATKKLESKGYKVHPLTDNDVLFFNGRTSRSI